MFILGEKSGKVFTIVDVLAVLPRVGAYAGSHAEETIGDEVGPLVVLEVRSERIAKDQTSDGVPVAI